jgi:sulfite exporter TauE/SafE
MNDSKKMERLTFVIMALLFVVFALGIAGKGDLQEAQDQAAFYDEMVCKGAWPDYEGRKPKCDTVQFVAE